MADQVGTTSEASEVAEVNAAAAEEQATAAAAGKEAVTPASQTTGKSTDNPAGVTKPVFDAQKSYDDLQRSYNELRKFSTQTSQERADLQRNVQELQKNQKQLLETIQKATEAPFDVEQFKRDFEQKGPAALDSYFQKSLEARESKLRENYDKTLAEIQSKNLNLETAVTVLRMSGDEAKYPNFEALYPKMIDAAKDDKCPVDLTKPVEEVMDALYNLAKSQSSDQAVKIAAQEAKKRAEAEAAKESKTTVAVGGKRGTAPAPNLETMPLDELEKLVIQQHGIADER